MTPELRNSAREHVVPGILEKLKQQVITDALVIPLLISGLKVGLPSAEGSSRVQTTATQVVLVFEDLNRNGFWDSGETGLANEQVCVKQPPQSGENNCSLTNKDGQVLFNLDQSQPYSASHQPNAGWFAVTLKYFESYPSDSPVWFGVGTNRTYLPTVVR